MLELLMDRLGYHFRQPDLLVQALTHRSKSSEHNERLEFLGDAIVNCVTGEALFHRYPHATEGDLSRWRASLINRDVLAQLGNQFDLSAHLILGHGEIKSGGLTRQSILSCAMEAVIGAIYLDSDFLTVRSCVMNWYEPMMGQFFETKNHKDPKSRLQEYAQSNMRQLPMYAVEKIEGEAHQHVFTVSCELMGVKTTGTGSSRRRAEQDAATAFLKKLKDKREHQT